MGIESGQSGGQREGDGETESGKRGKKKGRVSSLPAAASFFPSFPRPTETTRRYSILTKHVHESPPRRHRGFLFHPQSDFLANCVGVNLHSRLIDRVACTGSRLFLYRDRDRHQSVDDEVEGGSLLVGMLGEIKIWVTSR